MQLFSNSLRTSWYVVVPYSHTSDVTGPFCQKLPMVHDLTLVDFPTHIPDHDDHQPFLLDLFFCSNPDSCTVPSHPPLGVCRDQY